MQDESAPSVSFHHGFHNRHMLNFHGPERKVSMLHLQMHTLMAPFVTNSYM